MVSLVPAVVAGVATAAALPVVHTVLTRRGVVDAANERSSHRGHAIRGFGVASVVGWVAAIPWLIDDPTALWIALLVGPVCIALVGFADDFLGGLEPAVRFGLTAAVSGAVAYGIVDGTDAGLVWVPLGLVWIAYFTNAFNFMDGIDGVSATGVVVIGCAFGWLGHRIDLALIAEGGLALAATALAFGVLNVLGTGKFLGDAGSYFYGAALGALAIASFLGGAGAVAVAGIMVIYVADTTVAIVRRAARRERLTDAHREHVYQRLVDAGRSHAATDLLVGGAMLTAAVLGVWSEGRSTAGQAMAAAGILGVVAAYLMAPVANRVMTSSTRETFPGGG